jgi:DNA invertase Pin-like site-specific DNA recombinase
VDVNAASHSKVTTAHLARHAYLYVRQSTLRQVFENTESTKRQYALRERAVALGWPLERVVVIDSDLGQSGADSDRAGFQKLVAAVGMGEVGVVLGLEVSRLARSSSDWHRLLEICALTDTLILDEDGLYNPSHFNDRLLLGLKGTMSEAELHVLRARLIGGQLAKASRGELEIGLPVGLVYGPDGKVVLDPDQQVQATVRTFFATFRCTGSATATVRSFREQSLLFPRRLRTGPHKGELLWATLTLSHALDTLHNPRYAGAFVYGRSTVKRTVDRKVTIVNLPQEQWHTFIPDAHPGYISWDDYEEHLRRLHENAQAQGEERRHGPAREGPALLQGIVICGRCGTRMTVGYFRRQELLLPEYRCQREGIELAKAKCQRIAGHGLDQAVGELLIEVVSPLALEVALSVHEELQSRAEEADRLRRQQVERARYEADLAQRRYLRVDPDNRLVADSLEAEWNHKLRALGAAQEDYDRQRQADQTLDPEKRAQILALATDFPRLWRDPATPDRERKRMVRLMLEDVTLLRQEQTIIANVRFRGGSSRTLTVPVPPKVWQTWQTPREVVEEVDRLLDHHTDSQIASHLNGAGFRPGRTSCFTSWMVMNIRHHYGLSDLFTRLRRRGLLTVDEMASALKVSRQTVAVWRRSGKLVAHLFNDKGECLYEPPGESAPVRWEQQRSRRRPLHAHARKEEQSGG